jgi:EmrB/QacA subfamily drug resistance transporter
MQALKSSFRFDLEDSHAGRPHMTTNIAAGSATPPAAVRRRWPALFVLCFGVLMIVLDTTIVNVALPSIRQDLGFSETALVWVVNAYMLTFGGFLLLGGRLGDLYGQRKLFLVGLTLFTLASLACGLASSQVLLVAARAVQGLGGAMVSAISLSLIMSLFTEPAARAKAMGVYGFVCAAGGSIGVLLGGVLTGTFDWHWIFLVNIPIGVVVFCLCLLLLPLGGGHARAGRLDLGGAVTITSSLMLAVYAIVDGNHAGWTSGQTLAMLGGAAVLFAAFIAIERHVAAPLMPLRLLRLRSVATANTVGVLWAAGMFAWFFTSTLYLQLVLGYTPMQVGLAFLPANLIMAGLSLGLSARMVMRWGIRGPLAMGLLLGAAGLALFSRVPVQGGFVGRYAAGHAAAGSGFGDGPQPAVAGGDGRRAARRLRRRVRSGQHIFHDGRGTGLGRAG